MSETTASVESSSEEVTGPAHVSDDEEEDDDDDRNQQEDKEEADQGHDGNDVDDASTSTPNLPKPEHVRSSSQESNTTPFFDLLEECLFQIEANNNGGVDMVQLRKISSQGLHDADDDDHTSYRGLTWRLLLGYLPAKVNNEGVSVAESRKSGWTDIANEKRNLYYCWCEEWFQSHSVKETRRGDELRQQPRYRRSSPRNDDDEDNYNTNDNSMNRQYEDTVAVPSPPRHCPPSPTEPVPALLKELWTKQHGRDLHVLNAVTTGLNALAFQQLKPLSERADNSDGNTNVAVDNVDAVLEQCTSIEERQYQDFIESAISLDEIRKDVIRTHPDLSFYLDPQLGKRRYAALERILFIWSKYNKGIRYVQGMNEIVATLFYVLACDHIDWSVHAEADTYWLLHTLLAEMRDVFLPDLDDADTGIQGRIANMQTLLAKHDPEVKDHLDEIGVDASYYAIRWWTTLLSREFLLPDTIRLWDSMLASTHKDNFLRYVSVTMVIVIRDQLLKGDFSACLRMLQSYPPVSMDHLLDSTRALWIYESQITVACNKTGISLAQALETIKPRPGIIMAFGLRGGSISAPDVEHRRSSTRQEQLEQAGERAAEKVRDAKNAVATRAQSMFGRARGLYSRYSQEYKTRARSRSADAGEERSHAHRGGKKEGPLSTKSMTATSPVTSTSEKEVPPDSAEDNIYLDAILQA